MSLPAPDDLRESLASAAKREDEPEDLPPQTSLEIDAEGTRGKRYKGTFVYRVPTLGQQVEIGRLKSLYLPHGAATDANAALLVEQICYLTVTIQKEQIPAWWKPFEMYDATPISALYAEAISYERRFHGAERKQSDVQGAAEAGSENAGRTASASGSAVGSDVSAPSERRKVVISQRA